VIAAITSIDKRRNISKYQFEHCFSEQSDLQHRRENEGLYLEKSFPARIDEAVSSVRKITESTPRIGLILGSGLSSLADSIHGAEIPFSSIAGFPVPTVPGHSGILKVGPECAVMAGRFHYYEGHPIDTVVLPVFLLRKLGVEILIVTNAAGAVNPAYNPGDLVIIRDHLNLMGVNPLKGHHLSELGPRFPDMTMAYSQELRSLALQAASNKLAQGVYAALPGPNYETPAEITMLSRIGADMVGMSTVPEVIAARFLNVKVLGISCITNMAAGILEKSLDHEEVIETATRVREVFSALVLRILSMIPRHVQ